MTFGRRKPVTIKFIDKRTGEIKEAFSCRKDGGRVIIVFSQGGKEYSYREESLELVNSSLPFIVYALSRQCYRCGKATEVLTYLLYDDGTNESLRFPWDKERLNKSKSFEHELAHMADESIEYYPIKSIGSDEKLDQLLLREYPQRITMQYSNIQKRKYPMNICQHCGAKQGEYYIYQSLNTAIQRMEAIPIFQDV